MPTAEGGVAIASSSTNPRSPFARHAFVGANPYILTMLQQFGQELGATAGTEHFQESIDASLDLLQSEDGGRDRGRPGLSAAPVFRG